MDIDCPFIDRFFVFIVDGAYYLLPREDLVRMRHEQMKQFVFETGEIELMVLVFDNAFDWLEGKSPIANLAASVCCPSQNGFDS